jgi:hypothetical protein
LNYGNFWKFQLSFQSFPYIYLAVQQNGRALEYVHEALKIAELCHAAVQAPDALGVLGELFEYIPEDIREEVWAAFEV